MKIPQLILRQLYTYGSLQNIRKGFKFRVKNRLNNVILEKINRIEIDGEEIPLDVINLVLDNGDRLKVTEITPSNPLTFKLGDSLTIEVLNRQKLDLGKHKITIAFTTKQYGTLEVRVEDALEDPSKKTTTIPYDKENNYSKRIIKKRWKFIEQFTGVKPKHITNYSFDPTIVQGNIENFTGVAQVPLGFAGPLKVNGDYAQGEFLIPLATTEGTLVASYNRGIKILNLSGGVKCTVLDDRMQRAPVFIFESAKEAMEFKKWVEEHKKEIAQEAEATSRVAKLLDIEIYLASKFAYLRFNFYTGDAAGQNMVGRATFAACSWILEQVPTIKKFYLESNLATDKKASHVNVMLTRGKRVVAEATIPRDLLIQHMRVDPETLHYHSCIANVGSIISGANNNGCHSPNALTAIFIATGQDVANISEGSAGILYTEVTPEGSLYISLTIPALIVATYGGGTGLATQRECLEIMGCYGKGKVKKFAEIVAGAALAGEISLGAAISSLDWVSSHEKYGRNR